MNNIPEIKIESVDTKLKKIDSLGYTRLPQDTKNQNRNNYLDNVTVYGVESVAGINMTDPITPTSNSTIIKLDTIFSKTGNLDWKFTNDGGLIIPQDGTYIFSRQRSFQMSPTIADATIEAEYGTKPVISMLYDLEKEGDIPSGFGYISSKSFYTRTTGEGFTLTSSVKKGHVLYNLAAHKRFGQTFPVVGIIYATKIS